MSAAAIPSFDDFVKQKSAGNIPTFDEFTKQKSAPQPGALQTLKKGYGDFMDAVSEAQPLQTRTYQPGQEPKPRSPGEAWQDIKDTLVPGPGNYGTGSALNLLHAVPVVGPGLADMANDWDTGHQPRAAGHAVGSMMTGGPEAAPGRPGIGSVPEGPAEPPRAQPEYSLRSPFTTGEPLIPVKKTMPYAATAAAVSGNPAHAAKIIGASVGLDAISRLRLRSPLELAGFGTPDAPPLWEGVSPPPPSGPPGFEPIPATATPSGRSPGPAPAKPATSRPPLWEGKTQAQGPSAQPSVDPIPAKNLPSGRPYFDAPEPIGKAPYADAPKVITEQAATEGRITPPEAKANGLSVAQRTDINRDLHAIYPHDVLSEIAYKTHGVDSMKQLTDDQLLSMWKLLKAEGGSIPMARKTPVAEPTTDLESQLQQSIDIAKAKKATPFAKGGVIKPDDNKPNGNGADLVRGSVNIPLSADGIKQVNRTGQDFRRKGGVDSIHSSELLRTRQTASAVQKHNRASVRDTGVTPELDTWYLGGLEGQPTDEVERDIYNLIEKSPDQAPPPGDQSSKPPESFNSFKSRLTGKISAVMADFMKRPNQKILLVTHGRDIRVVKSWISSGGKSDGPGMAQAVMQDGDDPADVYRLAPVKGGKWAVSSVDMKSPGRLKPGVYLMRHGLTEWNSQNKSKAAGPASPAEPQRKAS